MGAYRCCGVHFVGSIPLEGAREVFHALGEKFGPALARMPDGETGERTNWVQYQEEVFSRTPGLEPVEAVPDPRNANAQRKRTLQYRLRAGASLRASDFPRLGYADAAIQSWHEFSRMADRGEIAPGTRYLVAIPTPFCVLHFGIAPASRAAVEPAYVERLFAEVGEICAAIPHDRLSIQWDCAHDVQAFDGARDAWFTPVKDGIVRRIAEAGDRIPTDIDCGYHLCYGSFGGRHFVEPKSAGAMVELTRAVLARQHRPIQFVHMPVPVERDDDAYFAPLADLKLPAETDLYLGLVHDTDGVEGTLRRAATARRHVAAFGIAAECGFGRLPASVVPGMLDVHRQVLDRLSRSE